MTYERHERWSFWILASCGFLPAMAPGIFIAIGAILWPTVYVGIAFFSLFHSLSTDLPWIVVSDTWFAQFVFVINARSSPVNIRFFISLLWYSKRKN